MVNVRPATRSASSFTLRREGSANAPRISEAAVAAIGAAPADAPKTDDRDETELGWRLRHLKRGVLRNANTLAGIPETTIGSSPIRSSSSAAPSGSSAKAATALFSDLSLGGQVNLLTTGAFDNPLQLLQLDRTSSVAFFSVGAPVGTHGDWTVRAAMNQSDLSSWMLAGSYVVKAQRAASLSVRHVLQPAALRGRQHRGADGGDRHGAQRRLGVRVRRVASLALRLDRLRRQLRALRLPGRSVALQPARLGHVLAVEIVARARGGVARGERAGRRGIHPADQRRVPAAAAHLLADLERGHPDAGAAELRVRRRARAEWRGDRRARVRAAHRRSDRDGVRLAPRDSVVARSLLRRRRRQCRGARRRRHVHACARHERARLGGLFVCHRGLDGRLGAGRVRGADPLGAVGRALETSAFTT